MGMWRQGEVMIIVLEFRETGAISCAFLENSHKWLDTVFALSFSCNVTRMLGPLLVCRKFFKLYIWLSDGLVTCEVVAFKL